MSIAAIGAKSAIWGSAANALTTPQASTSAFKITGKTAVQPKPGQPIADAAQDGLRQAQEAAGAFATDIMSALRAYRR